MAEESDAVERPPVEFVMRVDTVQGEGHAVVVIFKPLPTFEEAKNFGMFLAHEFTEKLGWNKPRLVDEPPVARQ